MPGIFRLVHLPRTLFRHRELIAAEWVLDFTVNLCDQTGSPFPLLPSALDTKRARYGTSGITIVFGTAGGCAATLVGLMTL